MNNNEDFDWDNDKVPDNFFDDSPEDVAKQDLPDANSDDRDKDKEEENDKSKEESKELTADEIFDDEDDDEELEEDLKNKKASKDISGKVEVNPAKQTLEFLKEKGIIDIDEDEEIDEDEIEDVLEDKWEEAIDNRIGDLLEGLPSEVKNLIKFAKSGGDVSAFFQAMVRGSQTGLSENMDISEESNQEAVMRVMLAEEDYDEEDIEAQIEALKDSGRLKAIAEKKFNKWKRDNKEQNQKIAEAQAEREKALKDQARKARAKLVETLNSINEIGGLTLTRQDKKELPSYFHDRNIKLQSGGTISNFHKDIYEAMANETAALQLAKLLRTRKKDGSFDFSTIERQATTKVTKEVKNNIRRNKDNTPTKSAGRSSYNSIADFF